MQAYCRRCNIQVQTKVKKANGSLAYRLVKTHSVCVTLEKTFLIVLFFDRLKKHTMNSFMLHVGIFFMCGFVGAFLPLFCFGNLKYFKHLCPDCQDVLGTYKPKKFNQCTGKITINSVIFAVLSFTVMALFTTVWHRI